MTEAKVAFDKNLNRARSFTRIFDAGSLKPEDGDVRGKGQPSLEERELLRAAVIFSIGALDAYLSDVAAEVLVAQLETAKSSPTPEVRGLLRRIMKEIDTLPIELALSNDSADRFEIAKRALTDHLHNNVSNHGAKALSVTLIRMNRKLDWTTIDADPATLALHSSGVKGGAAVLDYWTDKRHAMIHQGKAAAVKSGPAKNVTNFVEVVADYLDDEASAAKSS